jgi:hypothetical protein
VVVVRTDGSQQTYPREISSYCLPGIYVQRLSISFLTLDLTIVDHQSGITMDTSSSKDGHTVMLLDTSLLMQNYRRRGPISLSISMIKQNLRHCYNQSIRTLGISLPLKASDICNRLNSVLLLTILRVMTLSRTSENNQLKEYAPYCSCGSFKRQLNNLADFQREIPGYKPTCIHMTWLHKYRALLSERSRVRTELPGGAAVKCVAWAYAPPEDHISKGRFVLLHTNSGSMAPISHWRTYKSNEVFTEEHAWDLFFNMLEAGYVPFPLTSLPQLSSALKKK